MAGLHGVGTDLRLEPQLAPAILHRLNIRPPASEVSGPPADPVDATSPIHKVTFKRRVEGHICIRPPTAAEKAEALSHE